MSVFHKDDFVTILSNPSTRRLDSFIHGSEHGRVRGLVDEEATLYVWDAESMVHSDLSFDYGVEGMRLDIDTDGVRIVLAGGAHELMVPPDNLEEFFSTHGYEGGSLEDEDVLIEICETALRRARAHPSFQNRPTESFDADIDPRTRDGRRNIDLMKDMNASYASRFRQR